MSIQDAVTHGITLHVSEIAVNFRMFLIQILLREIRVSGIIFRYEIRLDLIIRFLTVLFVCITGLSLSIALVIKFITNLFAKILIIRLIAIFTLYIGAEFFRKFFLKFAHRAYSLLSSLEGTDQVLFRNLIHLTLNHHDILFRSTDHDIHIRLCHFLDSRINDILAINPAHPDLRDRTFDRNI